MVRAGFLLFFFFFNVPFPDEELKGPPAHTAPAWGSIRSSAQEVLPEDAQMPFFPIFFLPSPLSQTHQEKAPNSLGVALARVPNTQF